MTPPGGTGEREVRDRRERIAKFRQKAKFVCHSIFPRLPKSARTKGTMMFITTTQKVQTEREWLAYGNAKLRQWIRRQKDRAEGKREIMERIEKGKKSRKEEKEKRKGEEGSKERERRKAKKKKRKKDREKSEE